MGANGAGKSTLFAVLLGELHADGGDFSIPPNWQIAHVAQETPAADKTALDYTLDGDAALRAIEACIAVASAAHDGAAEGEAHAAFADADGYTAPARAESCCSVSASRSNRRASRSAAFRAAGACG